MVLYVVALLLPFYLSRVCADSRCATLEAFESLLLVKEAMGFLLFQLFAVGLDYYASCPLIFLPDFELLFSIGVEPFFLVFDWSLSWLFIVGETSIAGLKAWLFYFYFLQVFKEHLLSF